jgi:hypothetical protein
VNLPRKKYPRPTINPLEAQLMANCAHSDVDATISPDDGRLEPCYVCTIRRGFRWRGIHACARMFVRKKLCKHYQDWTGPEEVTGP